MNKSNYKEIILTVLLILFYLFTNLKLNLDNTYIYTKTIIIKKVLSNPSKYIKQFSKSGINIILMTKNKYKYFKEITKMEDKYFSKNISIAKLNTKNLPNEEYLIIEDDNNIDDIYNKIRISRGKLDNLKRANRIKNILLISTLLNIILFTIFKFPIPYNFRSLSIILSIYLLISITSLYLPYDTDIMSRLPLTKEKKINIQNIVFNIINTISLTMSSTLVYMYIVAMMQPTNISTSYFILSITISSMLTIIYLYSEQLSIINLFKSLLNIPCIIIYLLFIFIDILLINTKILFHNLLIVIAVSAILILWQDTIKLLRIISIRKK